MRRTPLRMSRAEFLRSMIPLTALVAAGCAASSQASPAEAPPSPVPPAALATIVPSATPATADLATANGPRVTIDNFNFNPAVITVPAGATMTWTNHDDTPHTVTASDNAFGSGAILPNSQFTHTFDVPGTYSYFCSIHPFMTGKVIVQ